MNFTIRPFEKTDAESFSKYADNEKVASFMTNGFPNPYTLADAVDFIEMAMEGEPTHIFCIEINGEACGGIGLHHQQDIHAKNMELGYWLAEPFWGNGVITSAIKQMVDYAFKTFAITRVYARPFGTNKGSQRALEKAGFTLEARLEKTLYKNSEFIDELIYSIRKQNH
ncbi:MAG: GNAT family N-acetyltransferase [Bacteroidetes bacterium]|nr:GNAT family N-acetyltransferase [Bacteroidota bacterium]